MNKIKKVNLIFWVILTVTILIYMIIHPRLNTLIVLLIAIMKCLVLCFSKKEKNIKYIWIDTWQLILIALLIWFFFRFFGMFAWPYHAPYEYKNDIQKFKSESSERYINFPDELPKSAKSVVWSCVPGMMQGTPIQTLTFKAEQDYIDEIYNKCIAEYTAYYYKDGGWVDDEFNCTYIPPMDILKAEDYKDAVTFVTWSLDDMGDQFNSGIVINKTKGYVCFYHF